MRGFKKMPQREAPVPIDKPYSSKDVLHDVKTKGNEPLEGRFINMRLALPQAKAELVASFLGEKAKERASPISDTLIKFALAEKGKLGIYLYKSGEKLYVREDYLPALVLSATLNSGSAEDASAELVLLNGRNLKKMDPPEFLKWMLFVAREFCMDNSLRAGRGGTPGNSHSRLGEGVSKDLVNIVTTNAQFLGDMVSEYPVPQSKYRIRKFSSSYVPAEYTNPSSSRAPNRKSKT